MSSAATKNVIAKPLEILGKTYTSDEWTNITPRLIDYMSRNLTEAKNNPLHLISERIRHFFTQEQCKDNVGARYVEHKFKLPVVTLEDNFDSLLIPKDHVSRRKSDTYYVNSNHLLRSHTSAHQAHCLRKGSTSFISIADCYRRDEIDRSHFPVFHQCEVFKLYNYKDAQLNDSSEIYDSANVEDETKQAVYSRKASLIAEQKLKTSVEMFIRHFFDDPDLKTRWVSAYFPFTHPSFELEIFWRDKWMEVLGCGVVRDEILAKEGIRDHVGFAAGFGLERLAMLKYRIPDIRLFWTKDTGFLHQFQNKSPFDEIKFKQFSSCPQCINDLSFWLPTTDDCLDPNDFYDLCRNIAGELIEQVTIIDRFEHPKTKRQSHCYRIVYRAADRVLTKEEVNSIHEQIAETCKLQFNVQIR